MTSDTRVTIHKGAAALVAVILLAAGAAGTYLLMRRPAGSDRYATDIRGPAAAQHPAGTQQPTTLGRAATDVPLPDVMVPLGQDAVKRAGIVVAPVASGSSAGETRLPAVVEPNAYRQVEITPLVAGRITRVMAALGDRVRRGQPLAEIHSPELAEAQTRYVTARAMLDAHDRELQRTEKLVEIGAASRQELERVHAEHAAQAAAVDSARSQLELLGVSAAALDRLASGQRAGTMTSVPAPFDGVVTERNANVGLNVDRTTELFTVVDLSTVWVVADVYEKDFSRVRTGTAALVTTPAYPGLTLRGRVSYIDPQVSAVARTARVRVEIANPRGELRLGMYADVALAGAPVMLAARVPRSAVQNVGERTVVYLADQTAPGTFIEREVRLGQTSGDQVEVVSGLHSGDAVVTEGSFFVRAERERLGLRPAPGADATRAPGSSSAERGNEPARTARVIVGERGFEPATVTFLTGTPVRITFLRTTDKTCATEVVFPSSKIKRALPLNEPVTIEFTPEKSGRIAFACGMDMLRGTVIVK